MSASASAPRVFISYSHKDALYRGEMKAQLGALRSAQLADHWDDTQLAAGAQWRREITQAIESARAAVLLISPHFFASTFIQQHELPPLKAAALANELDLIPVILQSSEFERSPLARFQSVNPASRPLAQMTVAERVQVWGKVTAQVSQAITKHATPPSAELNRDQIKQALKHRSERVLGDLFTFDLSGKQLPGVQLAGLDLRKVSLARANLRRANLSDVNADGGFGFSADLQYADLTHAVLSRAKLGFCNLRGALLRGASLTHANLDVTRLENADLYGATLAGARLDSTRLNGANLEGIDAHGATFSSTFMGSHNGLRIVGANLQGASFSGALRDADFSESDLRGAKLAGADLRDTRMANALLSSADLHGADLRGTDLTGATLDGANVNNAKYDSVTRWPAGFDPFAGGAQETPSR